MKISPIRDLATLVAPPISYQGMSFGQGIVVAWDAVTFENVVQFREVDLHDLPIIGKIDGLSLKPGDVVGLMGWSPNGGFGTWFILGEMGTPPLADPVAIEGGANLLVNDGGDLEVNEGGNLNINEGGNLAVRDSGNLVVEGGGNLAIQNGGDLVIEGGGDFEINDGGDVLVHDGGSIVIEDAGRWEAHYSDGTVSAAMGPIWDPGLTQITDDGLLVQDDNAGSNLDIFRALRDRATGNKDVFIGQGSSNPIDEFSANAETLILNRTTGGVVVSSDTTTDTANMRVVGNLQPLLRVTSAARYKADITDLIVDPKAVLNLRPRAWRDAGEVEQDPDTDRWIVGLVAEEVAEAGLSPFVDHNSDGEPESVAYDRLAVALLAVVQDQERRLTAVEARLAALDGQPAMRMNMQPTELPKRILRPVPVSGRDIDR